jgi:hypothetical protein
LQQNSLSDANKNQKSPTSTGNRVKQQMPGTSTTTPDSLNDELAATVRDESSQEKISAESESSSATETSQSVFSGEIMLVLTANI